MFNYFLILLITADVSLFGMDDARSIDFTKGFPAAINAVKEGNTAFLSIQDTQGNTLLHEACKRYISSSNAIAKVMPRLPGTVKQALETKNNVAFNDLYFLLTHSELDPNVMSKCGGTVLHLACKSGNSLLIECIINNKKIDVNNKSMQLKATPLHFACEKGDCKAIELLCNHSSLDPTIKDVRHKTVLDIACGSSVFDASSFKKRNNEVIKQLFKIYPNLFSSFNPKPER